jgi:hypothetical protein
MPHSTSTAPSNPFEGMVTGCKSDGAIAQAAARYEAYVHTRAVASHEGPPAVARV